MKEAQNRTKDFKDLLQGIRDKDLWDKYDNSQQSTSAKHPVNPSPSPGIGSDLTDPIREFLRIRWHFFCHPPPLI